MTNEKELSENMSEDKQSQNDVISNKSESKELDFVILDSGLLITSEKKSRVGWQITTDMVEPKVTWEWWKN